MTLLQFIFDVSIGTEFTTIQYFAISFLFAIYLIMALRAFFRKNIKKMKKKVQQADSNNQHSNAEEALGIS